MLFKFDNTYTSLPKEFYRKVSPSKVPEPKLIKLNENLTEATIRDFSLKHTKTLNGGY